MNRLNSLRREMRRFVRLVQLAGHMAAGALVAHGVFAALECLRRGRAQRDKQALVRWWTQKLCRIVNIQIQIEGNALSRPTLFVSNHVSWLDIPCLLAAVDAAYVAKQEVLRWPVIGAMAARADTIFLSRGGREAATKTADAMTWRLASRRSVLMFPEGTTTDGTDVLPFHARLFQAAIRTHSPVQALAIRYGIDAPCRIVPFVNDEGLLPHLWRVLGEERIFVKICLCDPVMPNFDRRTLAMTTRSQIRAELGNENKSAQATG